MKNRLTDLNDHLFAQIERLGDDDIDADQVEASPMSLGPLARHRQPKRAEAIVALSDQVVKNADLQLKAAKIFADHGERVLPSPSSLGPMALR